jgi:hypothetical protein
MMQDLFGHPIRSGTFTTSIVDGITGQVHEFGEDLYLEPSQRETGWPAIHLYAFRNRSNWNPDAAREWFTEWLRWSLPSGCDCSAHWGKTIKQYPPFFDDPMGFFYWTVDAHNSVNERISIDGSHPIIPPARAFEIWSRIAEAGQVAWFRPVNDTINGGRRLVITIATGKGREWLKVTGDSMQAYAARVGADFVALQNTTQGWWGLEKFRVHEFAKQYEETLYLDADILVTEAADESIFQTEASVSIHDEYSYLPSTAWVEASVKLVSSCLDYTPKDRQFLRSLNSGVVHCKRSGADVWMPPKLPIPTSHVAEQTVVGLNFDRLQVAKRMFSRLRNAQCWHPRFASLLHNAQFIHASGKQKKTELLRSLVEQLREVGNPPLTLTPKD